MEQKLMVSDQEKYGQYQNIFCRVLQLSDMSDLQGLRFGENLSWDSLRHIQIIVEVEKQFGVKLKMEDVIAFRSFYEGIEILQKYDVKFARISVEEA